VDEGGAVDAVVHIGFDETTLFQQAIADTAEDDWQARCESVLLDALTACQRAYALLRARGGAIVFVTPSASLMGASELAPATAAAEGIRGLMKSAARQWGADRVTVNCVAVPVALLAPGAEVELGAGALNPPGDADAVAAAVDYLASEHGRSVTGATIPVDGGVVMLP
jgi:3-oxoacyl-[acyl-carrier protein] reductase